MKLFLGVVAPFDYVHAETALTVAALAKQAGGESGYDIENMLVRRDRKNLLYLARQRLATWCLLLEHNVSHKKPADIFIMLDKARSTMDETTGKHAAAVMPYVRSEAATMYQGPAPFVGETLQRVDHIRWGLVAIRISSMTDQTLSLDIDGQLDGGIYQYGGFQPRLAAIEVR